MEKKLVFYSESLIGLRKLNSKLYNKSQKIVNSISKIKTLGYNLDSLEKEYHTEKFRESYRIKELETLQNIKLESIGNSLSFEKDENIINYDLNSRDNNAYNSNLLD